MISKSVFIKKKRIMEQFSLEKYLANPSRKVVTGDGCPVRILCTDKKSYNEQIVGLIMGDNGMEFISTWTQQGKSFFNSDTPNDLFFAPEKHEGWVNIYKSPVKGAVYTGNIHNSKEEAENDRYRDGNYVTTIKIEWEE